MPSVQWRDDDEELAVRDEVAGVLGRLTRDWALGRDGGRDDGLHQHRRPRDRSGDGSGDGAAVDLDYVFETQLKANNSPKKAAATYLHRLAEDDEVLSVLASMRNATLDLTEAQIKAMKMRRRRNDDGTVDWVHFDRTAQTPYVMDNVLPPWYAKTYYKVVAVVPDDGRTTQGWNEDAEWNEDSPNTKKDSSETNFRKYKYVSVYDGATTYQPHTTVCHPSHPNHLGGLYVSRTIEGCLRRDRDLFPECAALLGAKRALLKVRCWNPDRNDDPVFYGSKMAFTCVHVYEVLPYPLTWGQGTPEKIYRKTSPGKKLSPGTNTNSPSPKTSPTPIKFSPSVYSPGSLNSSTKKKSPESSPSGADVARAERQYDSLLKSQAATLRLEEDVRAMERRLERTKFGSRKKYVTYGDDS